jgi:serine/threonine protein kinase
LRGEAVGRPTYDQLTQVVAQPDRLVFRAHHVLFDGPCWQKTVALTGLRDAMFATEPQLLEALDHSNIVQVREAQFDPQFPDAVTFVMRHYPGGSATEALGQGHRFGINDAIALAFELLDALAYLHVDIGFVHRDVKPDNLLLDAPRTTGYLSDFGSAARIRPDGTVHLAGYTLPYLDPDAAVNGRMTAQSDIYSAGMTLLALLGDAPLVDASFDAQKAETRLRAGRCALPPSRLAYAPHVPGVLRRVVNKMMQVNPNARFASAADAATALRRLRTIDWNHTTGVGLDGEWIGTWPNRPISRRRQYRVASTILSSGPRAGDRRLVAQWRTATRPWRGLAGGTATVTDERGVRQFFSEISDRVTHSAAAS